MIEVIVLDVVARAALNQEVKWPSDAYGRDAKLGLLRVTPKGDSAQGARRGAYPADLGLRPGGRPHRDAARARGNPPA